MGEKDGAPKVTAPSRPTITLPPRSSIEAFFTAAPTGLSPGPMTLVSNFFSDHYPDSDCRSFSQLLAGAMASPLAASQSSLLFDHATVNSSSIKVNSGDGGEKFLGYKQNRPLNLVVAHSPMFMVPPGLSPSGLLNSPGFFSPQSPFGMSHQQALAHVTAQATLSQSYKQIQSEYQSSSLSAHSDSLGQQPSADTNATMQKQAHTHGPEPQALKMETYEVSHSDGKPPSLPIGKPANDGYNWRKYGQKQVKASECPRSYYKCTHLSCPVKKKVERSIDGHITEITYKGQHNHELPQLTKRLKDSNDMDAHVKSKAKPELVSQVQTEKSGSNATAPPHSVTGNVQMRSQATTVQVGSFACEEMEDKVVRPDVRDVDAPNPKRSRNTEVEASEVALTHKTVTESKIVVQTRSEVDLLDDGYKWRKYGQKVVKGNPHPRSYYRCTYTGCNVRKHVERASKDPKAVVTTYEGKHNHDLPAGRTNGHATADSGAGFQAEQQTVVATKPALNFRNNDQRPVLLQLKEEEITA